MRCLHALDARTAWNSQAQKTPLPQYSGRRYSPQLQHEAGSDHGKPAGPGAETQRPWDGHVLQMAQRGQRVEIQAFHRSRYQSCRPGISPRNPV